MKLQVKYHIIPQKCFRNIPIYDQLVHLLILFCNIVVVFRVSCLYIVLKYF